LPKIKERVAGVGKKRQGGKTKMEIHLGRTCRRYRRAGVLREQKQPSITRTSRRSTPVGEIRKRVGIALNIPVKGSNPG